MTSTEKVGTLSQSIPHSTFGSYPFLPTCGATQPILNRPSHGVVELWGNATSSLRAVTLELAVVGVTLGGCSKKIKRCKNESLLYTSVHFFLPNPYSTAPRDPKTKFPSLAFPPGGPVTFGDPWKPFPSRGFELFLLEKRSPNPAQKAKNRSIFVRVWGWFSAAEPNEDTSPKSVQCTRVHG